MKKIIITLVFSLGFLFTQAQEFASYKVGVYLKETNETKEKNEDLIITVSKKSITINNNAKSMYIIQSNSQIEEGKDYKALKYKAVDEENIQCTVLFTKWKDGTSTFAVNYRNLIIVYFLK